MNMKMGNCLKGFLPVIFSIYLTLGCSSPPTLKAVRVVRTQVESTVTTTSSGTIRAQQQSALAFGGVGRVFRNSVKVGDRVVRGQILAELENKDFKVVLQDAQSELKRTEDLLSAGLVSKTAFENSRKSFEIAHSGFQKTQIIAPFDGLVTEVNLELGEIEQGQGNIGNKQPAIRLVDLKPRIIRGEVDEIDLPKIKKGTKARVRVQALHSHVMNAEVTKVIPFVSTQREQDRTSEIELKFLANIIDSTSTATTATTATATSSDTGPSQCPDVKPIGGHRTGAPNSVLSSESDSVRHSEPSSEIQFHLIPVGASVEVELIIEFKENVLALPSRVILGPTGSKYVYRWDRGMINKTEIKTGIGNYLKTEIPQGLREGDIVIYPPETLDIKDKMEVKLDLQSWP